MYSKNDKRRIYWLIDEYLNGNMNERQFCDEYYYSFGLEIDPQYLNEKEQRAFSDLHAVVSRFSEFEEDHHLDPHAFSTKLELKTKIVETAEKLK